MNNYLKKNTTIPEYNRSIITKLCSLGVDMVLCGSEAGEHYGLTYSVKDIDFCIKKSDSNILKIYDFLSEYFHIPDLEEFKKLNLYKIKSANEKKFIELLKDYDHFNYDYHIINSTDIDYFGCPIKMIGLQDYIDVVKHIKSKYPHKYDKCVNILYRCKIKYPNITIN